MNISTSNNLAFRGYLNLPNGKDINTDDIVGLRQSNSCNSDIIIKDNNNNLKVVKAEGVDFYTSLLPAYTAACQNKNVNIQLSETFVRYI